MNLIEWFGQFLKWREDQNKRNLLELGEHFGGWLFEQTDAVTIRQQWDNMDNVACQRFVDWLAEKLTPDGLYIAFPRLWRRLLDPPLSPLTAHPALKTAFKERIRQDEVISWKRRTGAKGIFLNLPSLIAGDIKTVTAFVVPRKEQDSSAPSVYAENFPPDPRFSDSMQRAGKTCVYLLSWRGILWTWAKYIAFGNVFPISLFPVFRDIRRVMHWRRVLSGSHIYVRVDGLNGDQMIDPSIGFEASVAILLALPSISPNTRPKAPLPIQIEHFIDSFTSERINDSAFSGDLEKKGRIPSADTPPERQILATKRGIAERAGCKHVFLPKEKSTAPNIGVAILWWLEHIVKKPKVVPKYISVVPAFRDSRPGSPIPACYKWSYKPGPKGWAAVGWQFPQNNFGEKPGKNLTGYSRVTFWVKGDKGGEYLIFKAGGHTNPEFRYQASFEAETDMITLTRDWQKHEIDLSHLPPGKDLSNVPCAFVWVAREMENPDGCTFYLDDIWYER